MAIGAKIDWKGDDVLRDLEARIDANLKTVGAFVATDIKRSLGGSSRVDGASRPGQPPNSDTGRLKQSIFWRLDGPKRQRSVIVGTNVIYGRILELGGTIRPRNAKMLAVPIHPQSKKHKGGPRTFRKNLHLIRSNGNLFLSTVDATKKVRHYYVLVPRVRIAPRPYLRPAIPRNREKIEEILHR